jgi:hypothetical protein
MIEKRNRIKNAIETFGTLAIFSDNEQPLRHIAEIIGINEYHSTMEAHDIINDMLYELQYLADEQIETSIWPLMEEFQYV